MRVVKIVAGEKLVMKREFGNKIKHFISIAFIMLMIIVHIGVFFVSNNRNKKNRPPLGEVKFYDFFNSERPICCIQKIEIHGTTNTVVIGVMQNTLFSMRSGPPAYVFNEQNILIDWCGDIGDNPSFVKKWNRFKHACKNNLGE